MRVLIDAHVIGRQGTGNERYLLGLAEGFAQIADERHEILFGTPWPDQAQRFLPTSPVIKVVYMPGTNGIARLAYGLRHGAQAHHADVLHANYFVPPGLGCKSVITVHDVCYKMHPQYFSRADRLTLNLGVAASTRIADRVICDTQTGRSELVAYYPHTTNKSVVIPIAAAIALRQPLTADETTAYRQRLTAGRPFILYVGSLNPRKNVELLLNAYARLDALTRPALVIVGKRASHAERLDTLAQQLHLGKDVLFMGHLPDAELPYLYQTARVFVWPSLYEGFGLPPLEALACGCPVISSDAPAMPEVLGDAAIYFRSGDVDALHQALANFLQHPAPVIHAERITRYTWKDCAQAHLRLYEQL
jgi:glycosyltransferase involved in cell wall biosynthesis